ncbi:MAG: phage major capsid protein [Butyrivibrio sp.]|nr:phage major capsid protein [Butyrivibrio sp.]
MLKALILRKKIDAAQKALETLRAKDADFATREAELEKSIEEAAALEEGEEKAEAQKAVEEEVEKFDAEKKENDAEKEKLENSIAEMEKELADVEKEQDTTPAPEKKEERKVEKMPILRNRFFKNVDTNEMFQRDDVKAYLAEVRSCISNKREIQNAGLTIPEVFLGLLKENIANYSKLYRHVNVQAIGGNARQIIQGTVAEAIWTECCAALNELNLAFNDAEIDCFKVAGYYKVCNAVLEDSDIDLAATLLDALSQAIGLAVDKAILYGRNSVTTQKMPFGIMSRLAQTAQPAGYPATARAWVDLHTSNIISISAGLSGAQLFEQIVIASGAAKSDYSRGEMVWVMNRKTYTKLVAKTVSVDAQGRVVSGVSDRMPVIGGIIEVLNFIPDNTIIGGFFDLYLLGERAGAKFAQSEHVFFIQDQTAFKGTARYDGQPVIAEGFVAIGLEGTTPDATSVAFAPDTANVVQGIILSNTAVTVEATETAKVTAKTFPVDGAITWSTSDATVATVADGVITGVASGTATITAVSGSASASVAVTVTA